MISPRGTIYIIPRGGFGNILFIYLNGFSLAQKHGMQLKCIANYQEKRRNIGEYSFFKHCTLADTSQDLIRNSTLIRETDFQYNPIEIPDTECDYILDGYFQSYKYSIGCISQVKEQLFEKHVCDELRKQTQLKNTIALHVRRGDYLSLPQHHPVQVEAYYEMALRIVYKEGMRILAFSDDIPYLKTWGLLKRYPSEIIDLSTEYSFFLMTMCDHFIIANSSFSLLAYYFRDHTNAVLCMPKKWFGPLGPTYKPADLIDCRETTYLL